MPSSPHSCQILIRVLCIWLRIYIPSGVLVADSGAGWGSVPEQLTLTATNNGTFTVLVSDSNVNSYGFGGTGTYRLSSNGLSDELRRRPWGAIIDPSIFLSSSKPLTSITPTRKRSKPATRRSCEPWPSYPTGWT